MKRPLPPAPAPDSAATRGDAARAPAGRAAELARSPRQQRQRVAAEQMQMARRGLDNSHKELALLNAGQAEDEEKSRRQRALKDKKTPR